MTIRQRFQVGDVLALRRPQTAQGGREVPRGTAIRVISVSPVRLSRDTNFIYTSLCLDEHSKLADAGTADNVLVLSQSMMKQHTRPVPQWHWTVPAIGSAGALTAQPVEDR